MQKNGAEMGDKIIFDKEIEKIRVIFKVDDTEYSPEQEAALWKDFVHSLSATGRKAGKNV